MKRILIILTLVSVKFAYCQVPCENYCLNFDDAQCLSQLSIDTITFPGNIWQIGRPQKPLFDSVISVTYPNAIITDTLNPYPINNNSVFTIWNPATMGDIYGLKIFCGNYNVQTDSLHDYGIVEFSPDNGATWIDLINDTIYSSSFIWWPTKPVLTGNSDEWKYFEVLLADIGSVFNIQIGDTVIYRFTFISDSIPENLGGIMYDNICFWDFVEGISGIRYKPLKSNIYPNPSNNLFTIEFENPAFEVFHLAVYDENSKLVLSNDKVTENKIVINAKLLKHGIYFYKLTNPNTRQRSWGKFITVK